MKKGAGPEDSPEAVGTQAISENGMSDAALAAELEQLDKQIAYYTGLVEWLRTRQKAAKQEQVARRNDAGSLIFVEKRRRDLFEDLRKAVGCALISDLRDPAYRPLARLCLTSPCFSGYPVRTWKEMLDYLAVKCPQHLAGEAQAKALLLQSLMDEK